MTTTPDTGTTTEKSELFPPNDGATAGEETIGRLVGAIARALAAAGSDVPVLEARVLVEHGSGLSREAVFAYPQRVVSTGQAAGVRALAARRAGGEPLAYIVGEREFWSLPIGVTPDVLIPRPESELIVETALALTTDVSRVLRILDLGTGSGCLLLALLSERVRAWGIGVDRSPAALRVARQNATRLRLASRCDFACVNWGAAVAGPFDLVVANPPYIDDVGFATLDRHVRCFEPAAALRGGGDGLTAFRAIAQNLRRLIGPKGRAVIEVGAGQARQVEVLMASHGLRTLARARDLAGRDRCLTVAVK